MNILIFRGFMWGIYTTLLLYHFFVFIGRPKDKSNIAYVFFILSVFYYSYVKTIEDNLEPHLKLILNISVIIICSHSFTFFPFTIFNLKKMKLFTIVYLGLITILGIMNILFIHYDNHIIHFTNIYFIFSILYPFCFSVIMTIIVIFNKEYKKLNKLIILIVYNLILLRVVITIFIVVFAKVDLDLLDFRISIAPFLILMFIIAYTLINGFNQEYRDLQMKKSVLQMFINIAHLIKTPLTIIYNYLEDTIIEGRKLEKYINKNGKSIYENTRESLRIVLKNFDEIINSIKNFMDVEKLQNKQIIYNHNDIVNFSNILKSKIEIFKIYTKNNNLNINFDIENKIYIKIDKYALLRIINNLFENAIKYTNENGNISIILKKEKDKIFFSIKNTGFGISDEYKEEIFKPYFQLETNKKNITGIGMGLYIVKSITDEVGAKVNIKSEKNKETSFEIKFLEEKLLENYDLVDKYAVGNENILPIEKRVELDLNDEFNKKGKTVFVIEDNEDLLFFLKNKLKYYYNVVIAKNGKEALNKLKKYNNPDLIISDIMMDEMDGYEFYSNIKKNNALKSIPFLFLSAKTGKTERLKGLKLGAVDYIEKPFVFEELLEKINNIIKNKNEMKYTIYKNVKEIQKINLEYIFNKYDFSDFEKNIIQLILDGEENKDIADKLNTTLSNIKNQLNKIYKNLDIKNRYELINLINKLR